MSKFAFYIAPVYRLLALLCATACFLAPVAADETPSPTAPLAAQAPQATRLTILLTGDVGLNQAQQPSVPNGAIKHGRLIPWQETTRSIQPLLDADIVFANLETVVTDRNSLPPRPKEFNFRMHPAGLRHLISAGVNLISSANNHSMDYGVEGARDTFRFLEEMKANGLLAHAGLGLDEKSAGLPSTFERKGLKIAFSAIGITSQRAGAASPGPLAWSSQTDFETVVRHLSANPADLRILSIHQGTELDVSTSQSQVKRFRHDAASAGGIDLVVGHHQHVAAGVESVGGKLVFYGLGNFLHLGTQDMSRLDACRDYGLAARVHVIHMPGMAPAVVAVEAFPIQGTHLEARRAEPAVAAERIAILNNLSAGLDDTASGAKGLRFAVRKDGSGLYCAPASENDASPIGAECRELAAGASDTVTIAAKPPLPSCARQRNDMIAAGRSMRLPAGAHQAANEAGAQSISAARPRMRRVAATNLSAIFD